jgi:predicted SpoU family rRNA methylase
MDEDVEKEVEGEDEEVLVELGAADVPGKSIRGMAWNVASVRGF